MALTPCFECGKVMSTQAALCPNCGAPGAPHTKAANGKNVTTIQRTSKPMKGWKAAFKWLFLASLTVVILMLSAAAHADPSRLLPLMVFLMTVSGVGLAASKIMIWWHHE